MLPLAQLLEIDLSTRSVTPIPCPEAVLRQCLGGRGLNAWLLQRYFAPGCDPLGPDNPLIVSRGLLTGTAAPAASRVHLSALSPLTGLLGSSNVGGDLGVELARCQVLGLVIRGKATEPCYLWVGDDGVEIRPGSHLWGLDTVQTEERLRGELDDATLPVLCIGPAGEHGVRFACAMAGRDHAAGRTGLGAVLGAKGVKAIAVRSRRRTPRLLSDAVRDAARDYVRQVRESSRYSTLSTYGGAAYLPWASDLGSKCRLIE